MKYTIIYLACLLLCGSTACKKDQLERFDDEGSGNSIYFPMAENTNNLDYSFGYDKEPVQTVTLRVPVRIIGSAVEKDRPYKLVIADSSTMKKDLDYKILDAERVIRKGTVSDTLAIQLN
ncbi:MAG: DUF4843 domain-containing protein, partial [Chitinophagaceae bacterium]|nr:DUF4843 domain-containing protein [Chitinophagaceae bacterium]